MQANFFEQQPPLLQAPPDPPARRIFSYDNQLFQDLGPEYSIQNILNILASTYPELENGTWSERTLPDGVQEITFVKVTGEKGGSP